MNQVDKIWQSYFTDLLNKDKQLFNRLDIDDGSTRTDNID